MNLPHVQTKREIEALLAEYGQRPRKQFGQHFLVDGNLMRRLADSAELIPADLVLEVGPGTGGLTDLLLLSGANVIAVEIDRALGALMHDRHGDSPQLELFVEDILERKHKIISIVEDRILAFDRHHGGAVKLVANLPYQIATPLVMNLLLGYPQVRRFCFTVQAEVGDRITAPCNCKAYGPLGIVAQTLCKTELLCRLPPSAFWPKPKVESVMLRMDLLDEPAFSGESASAFSEAVRKTFLYRRKKLRSALQGAFDKEQCDLIGESFDLNLRPENLSVEEWHELFRIVSKPS